MKKHQKFLTAIANKEINWDIIDDAETIKDRIVEVVDSFQENVIYSVLDREDKEILNALNLRYEGGYFISNSFHNARGLCVIDYTDCENFLSKYLPYAKWELMVDAGIVVWYYIFNEMESLFDVLSPYILTKKEIENNLQLDLFY
jgi:hypothetical protein